MAQPSGEPRGQQGTDKFQELCGCPVPSSWCCLVISKVLCHCRGVSGQLQAPSGVKPGSTATKVSWPASPGAQRQSTSPALCRGHSSPTASTPSYACSLGLPSLTDTISKDNKSSLASPCSVSMCWLEARPQNRCQDLEKKVKRGFISTAKFCPL